MAGAGAARWGLAAVGAGVISPVGSVLSVEMGGGVTVRVQVISDGPPDVPSSAWGVTYGGGMPREYILVRKYAQDRSLPARYYGDRRKAAAK